MAINKENWPEGTKIIQNPEKTEIILPKPTNMREFGKEKSKEKKRTAQQEEAAQPINITLSQKNPDRGIGPTITKEFRLKQDSKESGERSQKHFRFQGKTTEQQEGFKLKKQIQREADPWSEKIDPDLPDSGM